MGWFKDANKNTAKKNIQAQVANGNITQEEANKRIAKVDSKKPMPTKKEVKQAAKPAPSATSNAAMTNIAKAFKPAMQPIKFASEVSTPFESRDVAQKQPEQTKIVEVGKKFGLSPDQMTELLSMLNTSKEMQ